MGKLSTLAILALLVAAPSAQAQTYSRSSTTITKEGNTTTYRTTAANRITTTTVTRDGNQTTVKRVVRGTGYDTSGGQNYGQR